MDSVDIVWAIKDASICAHFVDPGAAEFFLQCKLSQAAGQPLSKDDPNVTLAQSSIDDKRTPPSKRRKYTITSIGPSTSAAGNASHTQDINFGSALGPDWHQGVKLKGGSLLKNVQILYETECTEVKTGSPEEDWPVFAHLTNGMIIGCDLVISATGVVPNVDLFSCLEHDHDKGIFVDNALRTSIPDVFAAGDVCFPRWQWSKHWFQVKTVNDK